MEFENGNNDAGHGGTETENSDASDSASKPKYEDLGASSKDDLMTDTVTSSEANPEKPNGKSTAAEESGICSKEDKTNVEEETGNGEPKEYGSQENHTGSADTVKGGESKSTTGTEAERNSVDNASSTDSGPNLQQLKHIVTKSEEIDDKTENGETTFEGKLEDTSGIKPIETNIGEDGNIKVDEFDCKESLKERNKEITDGVPLDDQKASNGMETDKSLITIDANNSEKEETDDKDQTRKTMTELKKEEKETIGTRVTECLIRNKIDSTRVTSNATGEISDKKEDTSTSVPIDLVPSSHSETNSDPIVVTSLTHSTESSNQKMEPKLDQDDAFEAFRKKRSSRQKNKKQKKQKNIKICIVGMPSEITKSNHSDSSKTKVGSWMISTPYSYNESLASHESFFQFQNGTAKKALEDSLEFFEEPHEDQDPTYTECIKKEQRDRITLALKNLQVEEESGKKEIGAIINQQLKDKHVNTERHIEKHRQKMANDQVNDLTRLQQSYETKSRSNKGKIDHGIAVLRKKNSDENRKYLQQHRQEVQRRRVPEQIANAEWAQIAQRLNQRQEQHMREFSTKGNEVMNKCKLEFERERTRLTKVHEKRMQDLNTQRQSLYNRIYSSLQQIRQRHVKRHIQSIADRRENMERELAAIEGKEIDENKDSTKQSTPDKTESATDDKPYLRPVSPMKTDADWRNESIHEPAGAATRHKHRKGVLSQINRQLSVEIHNEGIWLSELSEKKTNQNRTKESTDSTASTESDKKYFFPWGIRARKILESIVCGEIPHACDSLKLNFSETVAQNGGHIRCVMTDLRTSDATASAQRAEAIMKKELDELKKMEEREAAIKKSMVDMEQNMEIIRKQRHDLGAKLKETLKDYEKTKQHLQAFRTKYANFFGPDGKPLPTNDPNDTRKLTQHGMKYKMAIESSEKRGVVIKQKIAELQASLQKRQTNFKTGERAIASLNAAIKSKKYVINEVRSGRLNLLQAKSIENPTTRVKDIINILGLAADMRRDQLNQKRNSNTSAHWVQSLPGVPAPLRRSLWYKMHRRRQQIVLRPTFSSMLSNMRNEIESKLTSVETGIRNVPKEAVEDKLIKAEQLYLLVTHPIEEISENLSSLPSSSEWAEPGWHLKLGVNREGTQGDRILPCPPRQPLVQFNLSELYSAPGRQAASMINSTHLRSLETPLSAVATATSLSETDPAMSKPADPILSSNDPLKMTRDALKLGYAFNVYKAQAVRPTVTRRKVSSTKESSPSVSTKGTKKKTSSSTSADLGVTKPPSAPAKVSTTRVDNTRKRKTTAQSDSTLTSRAVQRKRTEQSRQIPVDDQTFQPRPIMTQPQPQPQQPQQQQQQQQTQPSAPFMPQALPQQQQNPYNNQFMNSMPSTVAPQQQTSRRGSFNQFQNTPQMNQFRMMQQPQPHHQQQHHQQHSTQQNYGQLQQQPMRQNPPFFPQMGQQQFSQQSMQIAGPGTMQMNIQGNSQIRQNMATTDEQNDPLFMLK